MKISYENLKKIILDKLAQDGGESCHAMINGKTIKFWLSESGDGIMNDHYKILNCKFDILYAIYEMALSLGGTMYLGASAATAGKLIGSKEFPVDTIDGFISIEFYNRTIGDTTTRRSTYFAYILEWAGVATNHRGGYITINKKFIREN